MSVCHIINRMSSTSELVMVLIQNLTLKCLHLNIVMKAEHVSGIHNVLTDALSRFPMEWFHALAPEADPEPYKIPRLC